MKKLWMLGLLLTIGGCSEPQHLSTTKHHASILFDTAHGQTAGEADWVIDGAFSSYGDALKDAGYEVDQNEAEALITYRSLKTHDIFVLAEPNIPLKESEQAALKQYVESGGSILFISDHYNADRNLNRFDASEVLNGYRRGAYADPAKGMTEGERRSAMMAGVSSSDFLSRTFGVRFRYNAIDNVTMTTMKEAFNITDGVKKVTMHAGSTLAITDPSKAKGLIYLPRLSQQNAWDHAVDEGVYSGGGQDEGPFIAVSKAGKGKAAFIGDSSIVEDATPKYRREDNGRTKHTYDGFAEADHKTLLMNLTAWLARQEDYTAFQEPVEQTPIHHDEEPAAGVEPQQEPWARPEPGYLWYDRRTFAAGSYGAVKAHDSAQLSDNVRIISPASAAPSEDFQIKVRMNHAVPTSIALVTSDGQQMGLFSGRKPGESNIYTPRRFNNYYECYFNGRIAREADGRLTIQVIQHNKVVAEQMLTIN